MSMSPVGPNVWSGRALQENFVELAVSGLASMLGWTAPLPQVAA
jgi:hypothetical protein